MSTDDPFDDLETVDDRNLGARAPRSGRSTRPPRAPRRPQGSGGPRRPRPGGVSRAGSVTSGMTPAMRLAAALLAALLLIVILTFVVRSCREGALRDSYKRYAVDAGQITAASKTQGERFATIIQNRTQDRPDQLQAKMRTLSQQAAKLVEDARDLDPPDKLRGAHQSLLSALELRALGVESTRARLTNILTSNDDFSATLLSDRVRRFLASDVLYKDTWAGPVTKILADEGVTGASVSDKDVFLAERNADWAAPEGAKSLLPALKRKTSTSGAGVTPDGNPTGNLHGSELVSVRAIPEGKPLSADGQTVLRMSPDFQWEVTVRNGGDFTENVTVRVTVQNPTNPDGTSTEGEINDFKPKSQLAVKINGPANPGFDEDTNVIVNVLAVPDERLLSNNKKQYSVRFRAAG